MTEVVLASASPRRHQLLELVGIPHSVDPGDIDESRVGNESAREHVERLARSKATVVLERHPGALVVAADTVVVFDGEIMGKPDDEDDARRALRRLSGRTHTVMTGMACAANSGIVSGVEQVSVTFRQLTDEEIDEYVATREPLDKAGSYGIQGYGAAIVRRIDGDYFAVMGLSVVRILELMRGLGFDYHFGAAAIST